MGQCDKSLRLFVVDPDEALRSELRSLVHAGIEVAIIEPSALAGAVAHATSRDVVVVCVDTAAGLALVASTCAHTDAPPVIAIGATGFDRKSLEHVLLLAEVRGAATTLPKPIEAPDLVAAATRVQALASVRGQHVLSDSGFSDEETRIN